MYTPASSGPRCVIIADIFWITVSCTGARSKYMNPQMPHITLGCQSVPLEKELEPEQLDFPLPRQATLQLEQIRKPMIKARGTCDGIGVTAFAKNRFRFVVV